MGSALIRIFERPFYRKLHQPGEIGTTSACAENTTRLYQNPSPKRNYLRVRGEYCHAAKSPTAMMELPPRARRIQLKTHNQALGRGTTSAHAENT